MPRVAAGPESVSPRRPRFQTVLDFPISLGRADLSPYPFQIHIPLNLHPIPLALITETGMIKIDSGGHKCHQQN
jgi:hypothetical protein